MASPKLLILILCCTLAGCFCQRKPLERYRESTEVMGTYVQVDVCLENYQVASIENVMKEVWKVLREVDFSMSNYNELSDVIALNKAEGKPVTVTKDTYHVIREAVRYAGLTSEVFDITVAPLVQVWKDSQKANIVPSDSRLKEIRKYVGSRHVKFLAGSRVQLTDPRTRIDLGGIAAGFGVDKAVEVLRQKGFRNFLIDLGGDMYASGHNCTRKPWRIGIKDPQDKEKLIDVVELKDQGVTTSGDYEKFYTVQGKKWSHIIDPRTGYPERDVTSATVIAPTAMDADVLATALCVLSPEEGTQLIDSLGNDYGALVIVRKSEKKVVQYKSSRYSKYQFQFSSSSGGK